MVALAAVFAPLAADLEGRETSQVADRTGCQLIDGNPRAEVGAVGLARMPSGEKAGHRTGVVTTAVAQGPRRVQRETAQEQDVFLHRAQWFQDRLLLESGGGHLGSPARHVDPVGNVEESHAQGPMLPIARFRVRLARPHRLQRRQRERRAESSQDSPTR